MKSPLSQLNPPHGDEGLLIVLIVFTHLVMISPVFLVVGDGMPSG